MYHTLHISVCVSVCVLQKGQERAKVASVPESKGKEQIQMQKSHCKLSDKIKNQPENLFGVPGCQSAELMVGQGLDGVYF